jgi:membrane peptidoglycan carboxypeptidase
VRIRYPHFVNYIQSQIEQYFGTDEMFRRGFEIRTTLVPRIQDTAQDALVRQIQALVNNGVNTGAVIATDPRNGAILAMVGSPNFNDQEIDGQVNNVFTWQQPGSAIKPVVYTAALEGFSVNGTPTYFTPATILWDVPVTYPTTPPYSPVNYDRTFHGPTALRFALANSYNIPAVKTYAAIGAQRFQETAGRMGLRFLDEAQFGLATALGADEVRLYDMAQAFGTLANNGVRVPTFGIVGITDASGAEVPLPERTGPVQAVQPQIAYLMQSILSDNEARSAAFGLNSGLALPAYPGLVGAKTGTSNDSRDLWTMGFTRGAVVGVWIGRVDNNPTVNTSGLAAVPIWNTVMQAVLQGTSPEPFTNPGGVVEQQICGDTGTIYDPNVTQNCTAVRTELFLVNQPPPPASQAFIQTVPVDTWTNLRANQYCPDHIRTGTFATIDDASAIQWLNTPQGAAYAQQLGLTTPIEPLPAGECSPSTVQPQVRITSPTDAQQVTGVVQVLGTVTANNMNRYQIEVASINQPENFTLVYGPSAAQQPNGVLGEWNTTSFPNGVYRVRLAVFANDGGYIYKTVQIGVNNIPPTDIPLPTAIVPTPDFGSTTIPFDTPIPAGSLNSGPSTMIPLGGLSNLATPTATVDFGG